MLNFRSCYLIVNFLNKKRSKLFIDAISQYNQGDFISGISRQETEYYNTKLEPKTTHNIQLVKSDDLIALKVKKKNAGSMTKVEC